MKIMTTCIGAYPKPVDLAIPDWFNLPAGPDTTEPTLGWQGAIVGKVAAKETFLVNDWTR